MKSSENRNGKNILSSWLPLRSETSSSDDSSLKIQEKASIWLEAADPLEKNPSISTKIGTSSNFHQTIIRVFSGEPKRVVPPIQNQRNGQNMLDFLGRGFAIQGPATHSQPLTSRDQKPSVNQRSLLDFMTNPFASPSSTIVAPNATKTNNKIVRIYC